LTYVSECATLGAVEIAAPDDSGRWATFFLEE
jgi:hypothetical protein